MDGYLKIKTKIDNSNVDKGIKQLEDKIKKLQEDNSKQSQKQDSLQEEINKYEEMCNQADTYKQKLKDLEIQKKSFFANGNLKSSQLPQYESTISEIEQTRAEQIKLNSEIDKQASKVENVYTKLEQVKSKQTENNAKITEYKQQIEQINMNNMKNSIDSVGEKITGHISKLGKMALAVAGIRTAWMGVRRIISTVSSYNSQISTDLEYMGYAIANIFAPIVQKLINLLYTVLSYVNAISTAWFGINLFANSSAKAFQKMKNSTSSTAKSAKEIQKSLQGFDEMNVLNDNSSKDTGTSAGVGVPSMDLSGMQGEVPAWLQWIIDNKDLILSTLAGIATGILLIKFGLDGIKALGIGIVVAGIIKLIQDLQDYLEDPSWENFGKIISDIGIIIIGVGVIISSVLGFAAGAPVIIAGIIAIIVGLIVSNWEKIKQFFQKGIDWLTSKTDWVRDNFGIVGETIYKYFLMLLQHILNIFDGLFTGLKNIFDGILKVFKGIFTGDMKTVLEGFKQIFKGVFDALYGIAKAPLNLIIKGINSLIRGANKIKFDVPDWVPGFGGKQFGFNVKEIPLLARGTVVSRPTPAIIGEAGAEAVVPLENNLAWLDILADKLASKIGNGGGSYIIQMDSRTIQRGIARKQQELAFAKNGR